MSAIRLIAVSKSWGESRAVERIAFEAAAGSFVVLLGPSGCGKSTTLRLIAGLETADQGSIHIGGCDVTHLPSAKRHISMVFQSYALFPHLSVAENILFGLKVRRVPAADQQKRLSEVAGLLNLDQLLERKPSQLSGGQQQRVALGRAVIAQAPVCLMDEPLSNLDAQLRAEMRSEIRALQQKLGVTMVYVTHDQTEAMSMADQVILMNSGRIEQDATPAELYRKPATVFAARFIGTPPMNVVALEPLEPLESATGGQAIRGDTSVIAGAPPAGTLLGIRPEDIRFATPTDCPGPTAVHARVEQVEYLGADSIIKCRAGSEELVVRAPGQVTHAIGDVIGLAWDPSAQHFFEAASGRRIG